MSVATAQTEIKWYDRKLLTRSALVGFVFFAIFWGLAKRTAPPENFVIERLPAISGIYRCCDAGGRYSKSWVGSEIVFCLGISYYQLSTGRDDCGLRQELNNNFVDVDQLLVPTIWGASPMVSGISSKGFKYYELGDELMRKRWIVGSRTNAVTLAFILSVIFHGAQLILIDRI